MSRSILLIEPDLDVLGTLASGLRSRGLTVALADGLERALEHVRQTPPDAILVASGLPGSESLESLFGEHQIAGLPRFVLVDGEPEPLGADQLSKQDIDGIARRMFALPVKSAEVAVERGDFRGDVQQVGVPDLLQLLCMNRRSGTLSVSTSSGAGEVRLVNGEVVDAVYRRLEGEKALYRLLAEPEGTFAFASGAAAPLRRVQTPTNVLLMEGMRQIDELRRTRERLSVDDDALVAAAELEDEPSDEVTRVWEMLATPHSLNELLDDLPLPDLRVVEIVERLMEGGVVRRVARGAISAELADPEQLAVLAALVKRLTRKGFEGPPRIVIAGSPQRLNTVMHSLGRIADCIAPSGSPPAAPVPHPLGTLRISEGIELDVVGLPSIEAFSPTWGLTLPGSLVAVQLDAPGSRVLREQSSVSAIPLIEAAEVFGDLDEADPVQVAALIRAALEAAAGR